MGDALLATTVTIVIVLVVSPFKHIGMIGAAIIMHGLFNIITINIEDK